MRCALQPAGFLRACTARSRAEPEAPALTKGFPESAGDVRGGIADAVGSIQEPARVPVWQGRKEGIWMVPDL